MKYYSIGEFAKLIDKNLQTLREWDKSDKLKPHYVSPSGCRYYSQEQPNHFLGLRRQRQEPNMLLRFGFEFIENLCVKYGTTIEIIDSTEKTEEQELIEDLVQIITVFSCKLQGKRVRKARKMIKELLDNADGDESQA